MEPCFGLFGEQYAPLALCLPRWRVLTQDSVLVPLRICDDGESALFGYVCYSSLPLKISHLLVSVLAAKLMPRMGGALSLTTNNPEFLVLPCQLTWLKLIIVITVVCLNLQVPIAVLSHAKTQTIVKIFHILCIGGAGAGE